MGMVTPLAISDLILVEDLQGFRNQRDVASDLLIHAPELTAVPSAQAGVAHGHAHHPQPRREHQGKDARELASASPALKQKAQALLDILTVDPHQQPPPDEALVGDLRGACARRINIQHRLVYQVLEEERLVKVLRLWSHDA